MSYISEIHARQILDSRGNPTVEVDVILEDGTLGRETEWLSSLMVCSFGMESIHVRVDVCITGLAWSRCLVVQLELCHCWRCYEQRL